METHTGQIFLRWIAARDHYLALKKLKRPHDHAIEEAANIAGYLLTELNSGFPPPLWTYEEAMDFLRWNNYIEVARFPLPQQTRRVVDNQEKQLHDVA
jgi:hypothetical protein